MDREKRQTVSTRRSLKRKLEQEFDEQNPDRKCPTLESDHTDQDLLQDIRAHVDTLNSAYSSDEANRAAAKQAAHALSELAKNEEIVSLIVDNGAVPALVRHLLVPPTLSNVPIPYEHEVEKGSAFALGLLAIKPEHQRLIVNAGALSHLVALLKRHKSGSNSRAINGVLRRAADAITNLAHENANIKTRVRMEGGIPLLVELLEFVDVKVQRASAGALRTLAFKNDENK